MVYEPTLVRCAHCKKEKDKREYFSTKRIPGGEVVWNDTCDTCLIKGRKIEEYRVVVPYKRPNVPDLLTGRSGGPHYNLKGEFTHQCNRCYEYKTLDSFKISKPEKRCICDDCIEREKKTHSGPVGSLGPYFYINSGNKDYIERELWKFYKAHYKAKHGSSLKVRKQGRTNARAAVIKNVFTPKYDKIRNRYNPIIQAMILGSTRLTSSQKLWLGLKPEIFTQSFYKRYAIELIREIVEFTPLSHSRAIQDGLDLFYDFTTGPMSFGDGSTERELLRSFSQTVYEEQKRHDQTPQLTFAELALCGITNQYARSAAESALYCYIKAMMAEYEWAPDTCLDGALDCLRRNMTKEGLEDLHVIRNVYKTIPKKKPKRKKKTSGKGITYWMSCSMAMPMDRYLACIKENEDQVEFLVFHNGTNPREIGFKFIVDKCELVPGPTGYVQLDPKDLEAQGVILYK